jgi:hypothetical protein
MTRSMVLTTNLLAREALEGVLNEEILQRWANWTLFSN